jgi:hypothetical protein
MEFGLMTEKESILWKNIFTELTNDSACRYEMGEVNFYQLTSHLEELYLINADLRDRIRQLEKDNELLKSYAWER